MTVANEINDVSIRYTLALEDGTVISRNVSGDRFDYKPGQAQIMPAVEKALHGAAKGDRKQIVLSPAHDPGLKLEFSRLALLLGHPGRTLILRIEIL